MNQEAMELSEALDAEIHSLGKQPLRLLTEDNMVEQLSYMNNLINRLFRLIIKEKIGECQ